MLAAREEPIDVWDWDTFPQPLVDLLMLHEDGIRSYLLEENDLELERENDPHLSRLLQENVFHDNYQRTVEDVVEILEFQSFRGWHYTRLTEAELKIMATQGIKLSTVEFLAERLNHIVLSGVLSEAEGKQVFRDSALFRGQLDNRINKFWVTSHPISYLDSGVSSLLEFWGGEVVYMLQENSNLKTKLRAIGKPRIIEITLPFEKTNRAWNAARTIVSTFLKYRGLIEVVDNGFDGYTSTSLEPKAIRKIHTEGDDTYAKIGM